MMLALVDRMEQGYLYSVSMLSSKSCSRLNSMCGTKPNRFRILQCLRVNELTTRENHSKARVKTTYDETEERLPEAEGELRNEEGEDNWRQPVKNRAGDRYWGR